MARKISRAESWQAVYNAFNTINFSAFTYDAVKQSLIDYIKLYFPEYNNFIESDELIAIIETFAYIAELMSYRIDVASHENFMPVAQRKDSILRLAKLISYTPSRNLPARGLVKLSSIKTTETTYDVRGNNLTNVKVTWGDPSNPLWKDQFITILNKALVNNIGSLNLNDRVQVNNEIYELYTLNNVPLKNGVIPYKTTVSGQSINMELVSSILNESGPIEDRPEINKPFNILYGTDGLGDNSLYTGFFILTKQGSLSLITNEFDGVTPNQILDVAIDNINDIDVWVNNVEPQSLAILDTTTHKELRTGEWVSVDTNLFQNIAFNFETHRSKYEIETLDNDRIRLIFGDGDFSDIPSGTFHIWVRSSLNSDITIPNGSILNTETSINYIDSNNLNQTLTLTFSQVSNIQNSTQSEDIEHIRKSASKVYYTQDRMVNAKDYNMYLLQDPTVRKLKSINRSYAGESKYMHWHDSSESYENVKIFGDDLFIYYVDSSVVNYNIPYNISSITFVHNYLTPILSDAYFFFYRYLDLVYNGESIVDAKPERRYFTDQEMHNLVLNYLGEKYVSTDPEPYEPVFPVYMYYKLNNAGVYEWIPSTEFTPDYKIIINRVYINGEYRWSAEYPITHIIAESPTTRFWNNNTTEVINFQTLNSGLDTITLLRINEGKTRTIDYTKTLLSNLDLWVISGIDPNDNLRAESEYPTKLSIVPVNNMKGIVPMGIEIPALIDNTISLVKGVEDFTNIQLNYFVHVDDIITSNNATISMAGVISDRFTVHFNSELSTDVTVIDYVYQQYNTTTGWVTYAPTETIVIDWLTNKDNEVQTHRRCRGRSNLNFLWQHKTPRYHLVDPNITNIIDTFVITNGYYRQMLNWVNGGTDVQPVQPTPTELAISYNHLISNKMISDSMVMHPGKFKILFGKYAQPKLQARLVAIKTPYSGLTTNQIKLNIVNVVRDYFDINDWDFGEVFSFTELAAKIHYEMPYDIQTIVLMPLYSDNLFGDLFQITASEDEIFLPCVSVDDIDIVLNLNEINTKQISY